MKSADWSVVWVSVWVSRSACIFITWLACASLRASSCVSGCLSAGAKPTYTTDRKLQLYLGQHSPVLHPDAAPPALWERNPPQQFTHKVLSSAFSHFPVVHNIFSFFFFFSILNSPLFNQLLKVSTGLFCWSQHSNTHTLTNTAHTAFGYIWIWDNLGAVWAVWSPCLSMWEQKNANSFLPHVGHTCGRLSRWPLKFSLQYRD